MYRRHNLCLMPDGDINGTAHFEARAQKNSGRAQR
jgi:hypothetical protein